MEGPADHRGQAGHEDFNGGVYYPRRFCWDDNRLIGSTTDPCVVEWGAMKRGNDGGRRGRRVWGAASRGPGDIEQPVVAVHFADCIGGTVVEDLIEVFNFVFPFAMGALLTFWKEKGLARVEKAVDGE